MSGGARPAHGGRDGRARGDREEKWHESWARPLVEILGQDRPGVVQGPVDAHVGHDQPQDDDRGEDAAASQVTAL